MQTYQCHKRVQAAPITRIEDEAVVVEQPNGYRNRVDVPAGFFGRGVPQPGDYLVQYEDGYLSWSPKAAFEAGYRVVESGADGDMVTRAISDAAHVTAQHGETGRMWTGPADQLPDGYHLVGATPAPQQVTVAILCHDGEEDPPRIFSSAEKANEWSAGLPSAHAVVIYPATVDDPDELTRDRSKLS